MFYPRFVRQASCSDGGSGGGEKRAEMRVIETSGDPSALVDGLPPPPTPAKKEEPKAAASVLPGPGGPLTVPYASVEDPLDTYAVYIVRGTVLGTGLLGLAIFSRSIRLFTRFEAGREIPLEFVRKGVRLRGRVGTVEPDGTLRVLHQPLVRLPRFFTPFRPLVPGQLSLRLAGVEVSGAGKTFLRQNLGSEFAGDGKTIWFTLIHRPENAADKDVLLVEATAKLGKLPVWSYNLNQVPFIPHLSTPPSTLLVLQELVRRGLARVPSTDAGAHVSLLRSSPAYSRLVNQLLISERIADRRGVGMWQRETWVEGMQALPSQLGSMTTNSSAYRLAVLLGLGAKSAAVTTGRVGLWTLKTGAKVGSKTLAGSKVAIREGTSAYHKVKVSKRFFRERGRVQWHLLRRAASVQRWWRIRATPILQLSSHASAPSSQPFRPNSAPSRRVLARP